MHALHVANDVALRLGACERPSPPQVQMGALLGSVGGGTRHGQALQLMGSGLRAVMVNALDEATQRQMAVRVYDPATGQFKA